MSNWIEPNDSDAGYAYANVNPTSDTALLPVPSRGLSIAAAGTLTLKTIDGETVTIPSGALAVGVIHRIRAVQIFVTGTSATGIVVYA